MNEDDRIVLIGRIGTIAILCVAFVAYILRKLPVLP